MRVYLNREKRQAIERAAAHFESSARPLRENTVFVTEAHEWEELARTLRSILTEAEDGAGG